MNNRERLEGLHAKLWNIVDLVETLDLKLTVKQLLMVTDRISVYAFYLASTIYD
jgi:hypothetical protein